MRRSVFLAAFVVAMRGAGQAPGSPPSASEIQKRWVLAAPNFERDLEHRDGRLEDPEIIQYLQRVEDRIAAANGLTPAMLRVTRGSDHYAWLMPDQTLYLSAGLLEFLGSEAELAGLLAHQLAHGRQGAMRKVPGKGIPLYVPACMMASPFRPMGTNEDARQVEVTATREAAAILKAAGYDPAAELDLLSKLAYEHPGWAKAILVEDLLSARAALENEDVPPRGFMLDTSEFMRQRGRLIAQMGQLTARRNPPPLGHLP